jgi:predicted DNA-binding protein (MmcQ/YjbR family)
MILDDVRKCCRGLQHVTEDIKWGGDLVFSVAGKMFAVVMLDPPNRVSFKCSPEDFAELTERQGITPAPYLARASWVSVENGEADMPLRELCSRLKTSYALVISGLPRKAREQLQK